MRFLIFGLFLSAVAIGGGLDFDAERDMKEMVQLLQDLEKPRVPDLTGSHIRGNPKAAVKLVLYADFQCPVCQSDFMIIEKTRRRYRDNVAYVFKHYFRRHDALARPAALRFEAIALQSEDKAYAFHDRLFRESSLDTKGEPFLDQVASELQVDIVRMANDMKSEAVKDRIQSDEKEAKKFAFHQSPGINVGGVVLDKFTDPELTERYVNDMVVRRLKEHTVSK